ncbi:MAG: hypothetical protein K2P51_04310 [Rhabdochlamydiaceae bacterium]|nr:hypothetical protein [Rhabdochlamydiaceae bacterium]
MLGSISQIFQDSSLYGHCLTSLPEKAWKETTTDDLCFYPKLDEKPEFGGPPEYGFLWKSGGRVVERYPNGDLKKFTCATYFLPAGCIEWALRHVGGSLFTAVACLTAAPLGFAIKVIHKNALNFYKESP